MQPQPAGPFRVEVAGQRLPGGRLALAQQPGRHERLGELGQHRGALRVRVLGERDRLPIEVDRHAGRAARGIVRGLRERRHGTGVAGHRPAQQVVGHAIGRRAGLRQRLRELRVQAAPDRERHVLVEGIADQLVPERQPLTLLRDHSGSLRGA